MYPLIWQNARFETEQFGSNHEVDPVPLRLRRAPTRMSTSSARDSIDFAAPFAGARWIDIVPRRAAYPDLPPEVLLHAGPPLRGSPPPPLMNAAIQALLFEQRAASAAEARELILRREILLQPAQHYRVATPLAQVVSASMPLVVVVQEGEVCCAPVLEGPAPALRFGCAAAECVQRLRDIGAWLERSVAPLVRREPPALDELIRIAVAAGDECHARTGAANEALISSLSGLDSAGAERLRSNPAFVLPILMAAAAAALRTRRSSVAAIGGNGSDFGVLFHAESSWRQARADAPRGVRFASGQGLTPLAAIGDSAVIDFCGLGGQALCIAPLLAAEWHAVLPEDALFRRDSIVDPDSGMVDAARVARSANAPLINLAILDQQGAAGLIGRGIYPPPLELFTPAT